MTTVALEIGHGPYVDRNGNIGFEEGASGPDTTEYKEVSVMAALTLQLLQNLGYSVEILDPQAGLKQIGRMSQGCDIFVSLHLNAFNRSVQGSEVLIHRAATTDDEELAQILQEELVNKLNLTDRGVKRSGLAVLSTVPFSVRAACLTESFFVDSVANAKSVREMTKDAAEAIAAGIDRYARLSGLNPSLGTTAA